MPPTRFDDARDYRGPVRFFGTVTLMTSAIVSTLAGASGSLEIPFVLADITAGSKVSASLPADCIVEGVKIETTVAPTFDGGDTTGITATVGDGVDADGFAAAHALAGSIGVKRPAAAGALLGTCTPGSTGGAVITFTATGGAPDLADVTAGAGTVTIYYRRTVAA